MLLFLYVPLALLTMATAIPILVLCRRFERDYHAVVRRIQDQTGDMTTAIEESAKGIRVIKAFGRSKEVFERYDAQSVELRDTQLERVRVHTRFIWVLVLIPNLTLAGVLLAGALAVAADSLTVGGLVAFITYVLILVWPIEELGWILAMAEEAETAAGRVWEVFDTDPVIADRPGARAARAGAGRRPLRGRRRSRYPGSDRTVLHGVDLEIEPGETLALVGATGAGKTTVATLARAALRPDRGPGAARRARPARRLAAEPARPRRVRVRGADAVLGERAREPAASATPTRPTPTSTPRSRSRRRRSRTTCRGGSTPGSANRGCRLSGGQRQRLAVARAIIGRPRVLVLDDPLSALDVHTEALVEQALRPILADRTALVVVHRPSTIALADRAALLERRPHRRDRHAPRAARA